MEIYGKMLYKTARRDFQTSSGTNYGKQSLILEDCSQIGRKICVDFVEKKLSLLDDPRLVVGKIVCVQVDIDSREVNGIWFTNLKGWRIDY